MGFSEKLVKLCFLLNEKNAKDMIICDVSYSNLIDYFVIVTAENPFQVKSLADYMIEYSLNNPNELEKITKEGFGCCNWVCLDCQNILIHIFTKEEREKYSLQKLIQKKATIYSYKKMLSLIKPKQDKKIKRENKVLSSSLKSVKEKKVNANKEGK